MRFAILTRKRAMLSGTFFLRSARRGTMFVAALLFCSASAQAGSIVVTASDKAGAMMGNVVIYATPVGGTALPAAAPESATIAQQGMQFVPYVTAVRTGTSIKFPNYDKMEHHVKSFSRAREFEYKIYEKGTPPPVVFDKPGVVIVYCMLHEWMRAYVMVLDTPYFSKTLETGVTTIDGLPDGSYEVRAWHPDMGTIKPPLKQTVKISDGEAQRLAFTFDFIPRKRKVAK